MAEKIHYDDNIFFLTALIRTLSDAMKLHIDAEYFADKMLKDTIFIDSSIQKLYASLNDNSQLIKRNNYFHSILKLKRAYVRLIEDLLEIEGSFAAAYEPVRPKLRRIAANHLSEIKIIREELDDTGNLKIGSDMISYDELHFLMTPMDDISENDSNT